MTIKKDIKDTSLMVYDMVIQGHQVRALVDTGASDVFLSSRIADKLQLQIQKKSVGDSVRLADGRIMDCDHVTRVSYRMGSEFRDTETFHVLDIPDYDVILGLPWTRRVAHSIEFEGEEGPDRLVLRYKGRRLILHPIGDEVGRRLQGLLMNAMELKRAMRSKHKAEIFLVTLKQLEDALGQPIGPSVDQESQLSPDFKAKLNGIVEEHQDVVPSDPDWMPDFPPPREVDHEILLEPGKSLPNKAAYRMSQPELEELRRQLEDLLAKGYIQPSSSPYASPILLVRKPGSTALRMCVDYRQLNSATIKNAYPVPPLHECLDRMHGAKIFTKLDLAQGFHQIRVAPESQKYTAFRCRYGLFEFKTMPFGLCNAPATFQRLMNNILMPFLDSFCCVYMDDVLIFSKDEESHLKHVEQVLEVLRQHKLYARPHKCEFGVTSTRYLGHIVSAQGIHVDPAKIQAIVDWPVPKSCREVMQFKGLAEFYRRFVKDFSRIAAPLSALTKHVEFTWGTAEQEAFDALKYALTHAPILAPPDYSKPFLVTCDSSGFAVGAVLSQGEGDDMRVVAFESRKMSDAETRYENHDKELLAVIHALKKWDFHLRGKKFVVVTDNWATKYIQTKPNLNHRQMNWMSTMQSFDFDIIHRPGKENVVADALSRRPDYQLNAITWVKADTSLLIKIKDISTSDPEYQRVLAAVVAKSRTDFRLINELL